MDYVQKDFLENNLVIEDKSFKYYLSPIFIKNDFQHGFFTKTSSEIDLSVLSKYINLNKKNCFLNHIVIRLFLHRRFIAINWRQMGSLAIKIIKIYGFIPDCLQFCLLTKKRVVAALHCGRERFRKQNNKKCYQNS